MASGARQGPKINQKKELCPIEQASASTAITLFDDRCLTEEPLRLRFLEAAFHETRGIGQNGLGAAIRCGVY